MSDKFTSEYSEAAEYIYGAVEKHGEEWVLDNYYTKLYPLSIIVNMPEKEELPFFDEEEHDAMSQEEVTEMYTAWGEYRENLKAASKTHTKSKRTVEETTPTEEETVAQNEDRGSSPLSRFERWKTATGVNLDPITKQAMQDSAHSNPEQNKAYSEAGDLGVDQPTYAVWKLGWAYHVDGWGYSEEFGWQPEEFFDAKAEAKREEEREEEEEERQRQITFLDLAKTDEGQRDESGVQWVPYYDATKGLGWFNLHTKEERYDGVWPRKPDKRESAGTLSEPPQGLVEEASSEELEILAEVAETKGWEWTMENKTHILNQARLMGQLRVQGPAGDSTEGRLNNKTSRTPRHTMDIDWNTVPDDEWDEMMENREPLEDPRQDTLHFDPALRAAYAHARSEKGLNYDEGMDWAFEHREEFEEERVVEKTATQPDADPVERALQDAIENSSWWEATEYRNGISLSEAPGIWRDDKVPGRLQRVVEEAISTANWKWERLEVVSTSEAPRLQEIVRDTMTNPQGWSLQELVEGIQRELYLVDDDAVEIAVEMSRTALITAIELSRSE